MMGGRKTKPRRQGLPGWVSEGPWPSGSGKLELGANGGVVNEGKAGERLGLIDACLGHAVGVHGRLSETVKTGMTGMTGKIEAPVQRADCLMRSASSTTT